ncbi:MAG: glycosyltransferase family 4 protein [Bacteroidota bacterium]|nr:glycosyltransferase family 4 protein [Bacteroidota bacterium]
MLLLAHQLASRHEITIVSAKCEEEIAKKVNWIRIPMEYDFIRFTLRFEYLKRAILKKVLDSGLKFDVVHITLPIMQFDNIAKKVVFTWHFCSRAAWRIWLRGGMRYRGRVWRNKFFYNVLGWIRYGLPAFSEFLRIKNVHNEEIIWVAASEGLARDITHIWNISDNRIRVIQNAIHPRFFDASFHDNRNELRKKIKINEKDILLATVSHGRWAIKGTFEILAAIAKLESYIKLLIIGGSRIEHLKREAKDLDIQNRVIFCGFADPLPYLQAADIFVFPSWYEGFGLAPVEAAAVGLPVIASRANGIVEWLKEGETGLFCEPNRDSIASCINLLVSNPELRRKLSEGARKAASCYTPEVMAARYEKLYEESIQK